MCGIYVCITCENSQAKSKDEGENIYRAIRRRGPNFSSQVNLKLENKVEITLMSSVLHLRGTTLVKQPFTRDGNSFLMWNGEIFGSYLVPHEKNDTEFLWDLLNSVEKPDKILEIFSHIQGPWAFVYVQCNENKIWFGRDVYGRRSLLWQFEKGCFQLSSVMGENSAEKWHEVPASGIYYLNITEDCFRIGHYAWANQIFTDVREKPQTNLELNIEECGNIESPIAVPLNKELPLEFSIDHFRHPFMPCKELAQITKNFLDVLRAAVKKRVTNCSHICRDFRYAETCNRARIGILFSGGIDSSILAALCDECVPKNEPIDLFNVSFMNCQKNRKEVEAPDRTTGKAALSELQNRSPDRIWNFVNIDVALEELQRLRKERIANLINPCSTVLDDSIGSAIWFATRGTGRLCDGSAYQSCCGVVLLGMGADEQLAGYSRHRLRYLEKGWQGLIDEIEMEMSRISWRNLGRDDRVIADHGRESRLPFLDENVVNFLNGIPIWIKANLSLPRGVGEKLLLRSAAYSLGLRNISSFAKRAIQFGTRIAKAEDRKEKGTDMCLRL